LAGAGEEIGGGGVRAFPVTLPSGARYWTVIDDDLAVVGEVDEFLRHVRFGRDGSELTTRAYAGGIALYLRWCRRTGRSWQDGVEQLALFVTWLRHAPAEASGPGADAGRSGRVLAGPGAQPVRGARRVNGVLTAVRAFVSHAVVTGRAPGSLLPLIYEVADARDLPEQARGEDSRMRWRLRARHRLREPETAVERTPAAPSARCRCRSGSAASRPTWPPRGRPACSGSAAWAATTSAPTSPTCRT
jgi:hypothetical protein